MHNGLEASAPALHRIPNAAAPDGFDLVTCGDRAHQGCLGGLVARLGAA